VAVVLGTPSCSTPAKGSLILSITTDMQTPKDVDILSVYVETDSKPKFDYLGRVRPDGSVSLPSTLAIIEPDSEGAQVRIRVVAFQGQKARVLRDVLTTIPHQRSALLRLPLNLIDDGSVTGTLPQQYVPVGRSNPGGPPEGDTQFEPIDPVPTDPGYMTTKCDFTQHQTMVAGVCQSAVLDSAKLPDYSHTQVFGDGGSELSPACFDVATCFAQSTVIAPSSVQTNGDGSCSFPLGQGVGGALANVALATPSTGTPVNGIDLVPLESDPGEGFSVQGTTVTLVPGVCAQLQKPGTQLVVATSSACASKTESSPVCEPTMVALDGGAPEVGAPDVGAPDVGEPDVGATDVGAPATDASQCPAGQTICPGGCVDLSTDARNCGTCGNACTGGQCSGGSCVAALSDAGVDAHPACVPTTCASRGYDCGYAADGCGGLLQCGTCTAPGYCGGGGFDLCGISGGGSCVPRTCPSLGYDCGAAADGCGSLLQCGTCTSPQYCGGGGFDVCGTAGNDGGGPCVPQTCASLGYTCGAVADGCGGLLQCGMCTAPQFCGGGGYAKCGGNSGGSCVPATCASLGYNCGFAADGCGGTLVCGTCNNPQFCGGGGPNLCGAVEGGTCTPLTCASYAAGTCGQQSDGCGGLTANCSSCTAPQTCGGGGVPNQCGQSDAGQCTPLTCGQQNITCGPAGDGCGNQLQCGTCVAPQTCGGGGVPSHCGQPAIGQCTPLTCMQQNISCGPASDGCGNQLQCGTCAAPQTCGGGGVVGQCGLPSTGQCTPQSCAQQNISCGPAGDGCGNELQCGTCAPPQTCGGGGFGRCG
jgi:hypothetical protein